MNSLLIVDMQDEFPSSKKHQTICECIKLICRAKLNLEPIIVLEYVNFGNTLTRLSRMLSRYDRRYLVKKNDNDGSDEIHDFVVKTKLGITDFTICGVNLDACVQETATGLAEIGYNVKVVKKACNTDGPRCFSESGWRNYPKMANLKVT